MSTDPDEFPDTPDTYEGAAEVDPDNWRDDPLLELSGEEEPEASHQRVLDDAQDDLDADPDPDEPGVDLDHPVNPSEQDERDELAEQHYRLGEEQIPPEEPTIGQALADLDIPEDKAYGDEIDSSNDAFHGGADT